MQRVGPILDFNGQIQVLKDTVKQSQCPLNIYLDIKQLPDWEEEPALQGCKCDDTTEGDSCVQRAINNLQSCYEIDNSRRDREEDANEHEKPAAYHLLAYFQVGQVLILLLKALLGIFLASKSLRQQDAADRERLLHHGGERGHALFRFLARRTAYVAYILNHPQEDCKDAQRY